MMVMNFVVIVAACYLVLCAVLFFIQEKLIFFPEKMQADANFAFKHPFKELKVNSRDGTPLSAVLFTANQSRGLVFYLHGNAGSIQSWGSEAEFFNGLAYDVCMMDYRGYGKSGGRINSEEQFLDDIECVYREMLGLYSEKDVVVLGYSLGTGAATWLASRHHPRLLILQAPYFNIRDMMQRRFPFVTTRILKYNFSTNEWLPACKMPVCIFHGDHDEVIYFGSSVKLQSLFKQEDTLITLKSQMHMGMIENPFYRTAMQELLVK